jgi:hypothetical protein
MVGPSRCDVPARVLAGGANLARRVILGIRFRRLTLRSATGSGAARRPYPKRGEMRFYLQLRFGFADQGDGFLGGFSGQEAFA